MTNQRALELLMIERACVKRGSGMEGTWVTDNGLTMYTRYDKVHDECDRNCAVCPLVQDSKELLEMYDKVIWLMTEKAAEEDKPKDWRDWQRECEKEPLKQLAI